MRRKKEKAQNSIQYAAFRRFWLSNVSMTPAERFMVAIVQTCDERFSKLLKNKNIRRLVGQWEERYNKNKKEAINAR